MLIHVSTDSTVRGGADLEARVRAMLAATVDRFGPRLTRVDVHLADVNGDKSRGVDKRCVIEARPANRPPVSVTHVAATFAGAVGGAKRKLVRSLGALAARARPRPRRGA